MSGDRAPVAVGTPEQVLAVEVARLRRDFEDLRSTALARITGTTAARTSRVFLSAAPQSLATGVADEIAFDGETDDDFGMHAASSTQLVLAQVGIWIVVGQVTFLSNATGFRSAILRRNGTQHAIAQQPAVSGAQTCVPVADRIVATADSDYVELVGFQNSGGALDVQNGTSLTFLTATYLGT